MGFTESDTTEQPEHEAAGLQGMRSGHARFSDWLMVRSYGSVTGVNTGVNIRDPYAPGDYELMLIRQLKSSMLWRVSHL